MKNHFATRSVHGGEEKRKPFGALTTPIVQTSTYTFADTKEILDFMHQKEDEAYPLRDEYGRYSNPTQTAAERKLADLEGGERALLFSSGMSAISTTLLSRLSNGDHIVMTSDNYHRTQEFALSFLERWGIKTTFVPIDRLDLLETAIQPNTRLIFSETPTNPYLRILDLASLAKIAHHHHILTIIDSTFATPINLQPFEYGIDLVIHSATKYLGGHNDLLAGVVIGSKIDLAQIEASRGILGTMSNPNDAYLLLRGLKTFELRIQRQNLNGLNVAQFLEDHPAVLKVYYPGLSSHPDFVIAKDQMNGFGGVVSFEIDGDFEKTARFIDRLKLPYIGPTLGGVESVIQQPAALFSLRKSERLAHGIKDNLVRYAVGIEDAEDIITDLGQALAKL